MKERFFRNDTVKIIADHKPRAVGIGCHDQAALFGKTAKERFFFFILKDTKAVGGNNIGIKQRGKLDLVILSFHHDHFVNFDFFHLTLRAH